MLIPPIDKRQIDKTTSEIQRIFDVVRKGFINDGKTDFRLDIYTDGSYSLLSNCGGWAVVVRMFCNETFVHETHILGNTVESTNNRMEVTAVVHALELICRLIDGYSLDTAPEFHIDRTQNEHIQMCYAFQAMTYRIYSDSEYTIKTCRSIFRGSKNPDLVKMMKDRYNYLIHKLSVDLFLDKIKAHMIGQNSGTHHQFNHTADGLANEMRLQMEDKMKKK